MLKIGFIGGVNAMPMGYALKFLKAGYDVKYIVESDSENYLMRPEHQYSADIIYPYPDWINEIQVPYTLIGHAFPRKTYQAIYSKFSDRDVIFLNDFGLALAPFLPPNAKLIALCSGSDLDVFCSYRAVWSYAITIRRKWLIPIVYTFGILRAFNQRRGLKKCSAISYFPKGLNKIGDDIINEITNNNPKISLIPRYDVNFNGTGIKFHPIARRFLKKILVPVRFNINPVTGSSFEYKGNDLIIEALAKYKLRNKAIEIKFFLKGPTPDITIAKKMCEELGLSENVEWLNPMPLPELLQHYYDCDICFDQVGSHWMGAVGLYALYSGRPLIANARPDVFRKMWGDETPILQASSIDEIYEHLVRCEDFEYRQDVSKKGHEFAVAHLDTEAVYIKLAAFINTKNQ